MTAIEDPRRVRRSQDGGAVLGLAPRRCRSGEVDVKGRIPRCGDRLTRKLPFEAAEAMPSRRSRPLAPGDWGAAIARRSGFWKARAAVARGPPVILHRMGPQERPFRPSAAAAA